MKTNITQDGKNTERNIWRKFDDYHELLEVALDESRLASHGENSPDEIPRLSSKTHFGENHWDLGVGWDNAKRMAERDGWPEGLERVNRIADAITESMSSQITITVPEREVQGAAIDIGAFMTGEPECFWTFNTDQEASPNGKIVTIGIRPNYHYNVHAETFVLRGAAVLALVDLLQKAGYETEIIISLGLESLGGANKLEDKFTLKRAGENVDPGRMAFVLGHPAFQRRIGFRLREQLPRRYRKAFDIQLGGGYGRSVDVESTKEECDIWVGGRFEPTSERDVTDWVRKNLIAQGVQLEGH